MQAKLVAIVGADEFKWKNERQKALARDVIRALLLMHKAEGPIILVSGGCPKGGVDIWAEEIADELGIDTLIFKPEKPHYYYYMKRNKRIAEACDVIYAIVPMFNLRSGAIATLRMATEMGKPGYIIEVGEESVKIRLDRGREK